MTPRRGTGSSEGVRRGPVERADHRRDGPLSVPIEDVADLVTGWRRARSPAERARIAATGARTLRSLSVDERRVVAQGLAERGAPAVAAQLERYGPGPLSSRQLTELATALQSVDRSQLEGLAASLADPAERHRLARAAGAAAVDGPPPPTGPPLSGPAPAPPAAPTGDAIPLPPPVPGPDASADLSAWQDGPDGPEHAADDTGATHDTDDVDDTWGIDATDDAGATHDAEPADPVEPTSVPSVPLTPTFDPAPTLADIDRAGSVRARLAAATSLAGTPLSSADLTAVLRQVPDGWQRRTVARRLLAAGGVVDVDAEQVLTAFERHSDRTAIAHVLVDGDLAHVETVTDHLDPSAARRLRRRTDGAA